ncbi:MAG TPA: DUF4112 domain-containing protein [Tepidisphaeraceae bacterium]
MEYSDEVLQADIQRVRRLAKSLDSQFQIAGMRLGWDSIIGLVPVAGDLVTAMIGLYPIIIARKHGLSKSVQTRMAANLLLDWAVGEIPLLGDAFDVFFRANLKNADLLERAAQKRSPLPPLPVSRERAV